MNSINLTLNLNNENTAQMRDILGINNTPRIPSSSYTEENKKIFDRLSFSYIRHHDASLENSSQQIIDVSRVFPLFHLDETDYRNYYFEDTDNYFSVVKDSDAEWEIRLGETIDHSGFYTRVNMPSDAKKWARICLNIVKHYKEEKNINITSVSVWEEPENLPLFTGTILQYFTLYTEVYKLFKKELPSVRIGAPNCGTHRVDFFEDFIKLCVENKVIPDYVSQTIYPLTVDLLLEAIEANINVLDKYGLNNTPYVLSEWHYGGPGSFIWKVKKNRRLLGNFDKTECASFTATALIKLHDFMRLEKAYYYSWGFSVWAPYNLSTNELTAEYYALLYYQQVCKEGKVRVPISISNTNNVAAIASKTEDGKIYVLISVQNLQVNNFIINASNYKNCTMYAVREDFNLTIAENGEVIIANEKGEFTFEHYTGNGVYMLIFN